MELGAFAGRANCVVATPALDSDLIARVLDGDGEAFGPLVQRYGDVVYRTIFLMTRDRPLAEDLTQDAFVHAWRGLSKFRAGSPLQPWLLRIAANRVISHHRRRRLSLVPLPWAQGRIARDDAAPETSAERAATTDQIREALASLPDDQRIAVTLRYYADLSVPEIAQATGWRQGTVKSRLHRALGRLRPLLEPARGEQE